jgi:hypothetical protein
MFSAILPVIGSFMISFFTTINYLPSILSSKELDSLQYFHIGASSLVQTGLAVLTFGLVY